MVPGGGRGGEEVALVGQVVQQGLGAGPGDVGFEQLNKFLFAGHGVPPVTGQKVKYRNSQNDCTTVFFQRKLFEPGFLQFAK